MGAQGQGRRNFSSVDEFGQHDLAITGHHRAGGVTIVSGIEVVARELRPLFRAYKEQREAGEHFGDFLVRTGVIEAERTPGMAARVYVDKGGTQHAGRDFNEMILYFDAAGGLYLYLQDMQIGRH